MVDANAATAPNPALSVACALIAATISELGIDTAETGVSVPTMFATPGITRVMFAAKQLSDYAEGAAKRRRFARLAYTCNL